MSRDAISVIIPTLDEQVHIERTLTAARHPSVGQVIVVDGGSRDRTAAIARACGATVLSASPGRAAQMNAGAAAARGGILLFLHADTRLPPDFAAHVTTIMSDPGVAVGAFSLRIDAPHAALRLIERLVQFRSRFLRMPYGDQALFCRADLFRRIGGFPDLPIMEDFEYIRRARAAGRVRLASAAVETSARRWLQRGILRTTLLNQWCIAGHLLGAPSQRVAVWRRGAEVEPSRVQPVRPATGES